jgi:hypothetical protein
VKRFVVLGFALVAFLSLSSVAVAARETTLTGTSVWTGATFESQQSTTAISGTFSGGLGKGTYEGTLVGGAFFSGPDCGPVCQPVTGSITFSSNRGTFTGVVQEGSTVALFDSASTSIRYFILTLTVVNGTKGYAHANGSTLSLTYISTWSHPIFDPNNTNVISDAGTLTGTLH